ncbi:hypothetical protein Ancab_023587 [Ancistrocladus abbreviatus]
MAFLSPTVSDKQLFSQHHQPLRFVSCQSTESRQRSRSFSAADFFLLTSTSKPIKMEAQEGNSSDIRWLETEVGSAKASNTFTSNFIEDFNDVPSNQGNFVHSTIDSSAHPSKKARSKVWDHLIKIWAKNLKNQKAKYKYCGAILGANPAKGTTCLKNHIDRCKKYPANIDKAQRKLTLQAKFSVYGNKLMMEGEPIGKLENWRFRQEDARKALVRMIIMDELPC